MKLYNLLLAVLSFTSIYAQSIPISGDNFHLYGPNSSWGAYLRVGGNGNDTNVASVVATNGNLHLDAKTGYSTYLNYYNKGNTYLNTNGGNVGIGNASPQEKLELTGRLKWSENGTSNYGILSLNSGWNSASIPTVGGLYGGSSLIALHNPHTPYRKDNAASGFSGRAGIRASTAVNGGTFWDFGLAGDFFHIFRNGSGEFLRITNNGNLGIGTSNPDEKLTVKGKIHAEEVRVDLSVPAPDYVFYDTYNLKTLEELESYIQGNKHLPEVPSARDFEKDGISVGEMNMLLLKKVEELTLYLIDEHKKNAAQDKIIKKLQLENQIFKKKIADKE